MANNREQILNRVFKNAYNAEDFISYFLMDVDAGFVREISAKSLLNELKPLFQDSVYVEVFAEKEHVEKDILASFEKTIKMFTFFSKRSKTRGEIFDVRNFVDRIASIIDDAVTDEIKHMMAERDLANIGAFEAFEEEYRKYVQ